MSENTVKWHPYPQEKPKKDTMYLVSIENFTSTSYWTTQNDAFDIWDKCTSAWAEMPKPYKEEKHDKD